MKISFHGAARGVTGSCYLVETKKKKLLVDCGLFQGGHKQTEENSKPLQFDPTDIDYLILTHAHLDHCGRLPLLVKNGFRGKILTTLASKELAQLVMLDAAHIAAEDAKRKNRNHTIMTEPLYTKEDVINTMELFKDDVTYNSPVELSDGISAEFYDAGHILGSASVLLGINERNRDQRIAFSGDIGNKNKPLLRDPVPPKNADFVIMESLYGDRSHKPIDQSVIELYSAINETFGRGGNVFIPAFALDRTQNVLFFLREGIEKGILPKSIKVFIDSPMAISATEIFRRHPECYDEETQELLRANIDPFGIPNLTFSKTVDESKKINDLKSGAVILAGSGMCTGGGRIIHHLKNNLDRKECSFIFINYATEGTLARKIIDGAKTVKMFGSEISVKAKIYTINGFSAHAGRNGLIEWHSSTGSPAATFLTHGSYDSMKSLAGAIRAKGHDVEMPELHDTIKI